jgi:hypothetical protein
MLDLVGAAELRRGTSLFAAVTGLARIAGPGVAGIIIAASGETAVFFIDAAWHQRPSSAAVNPGTHLRVFTIVAREEIFFLSGNGAKKDTLPTGRGNAPAQLHSG